MLSTQTAATDSRPEGPLRRRPGFRPDLHAIRAVAVVAVVLYHFWPNRLPGGYIGVDVFFVVSGYLMAARLLKEWRQNGKISLARFWASRARRLLPAALLTLAAVLIVLPFAIPESVWPGVLKEIAASALYVENWALAADSVDYLAADAAASPLRHFWSLSVEEQYYLVWPLAMLAIILLARGRSARASHLVGVGTVALIAGVSLGLSIFHASIAPADGYFLTQTRVWEFAVGALVAWMTPRGSAALRSIVGWAGWAAIVASAFLFTDATPYPGTAAVLPVLGAAAAIWAGDPGTRWSPRILAGRPVVFIGDISYGLYLWHWPVLMIVGYHVPLGSGIKVALIVVCVLLAWMSTRLVEDPIRYGALLRSSRRAFIGAAIGIALIAGPALIGWAALHTAEQRDLEAAADAAVTVGPCFGAEARDPAQDCDVNPVGALVPAPASALRDDPDVYAEGCIPGLRPSELVTCTRGVEGAPFRVAVIGDSHATHWLPAVEEVAERSDWEVTTILKSACPHSAALKLSEDMEIRAACRSWNDQVDDLARTGAPFDLVFVSASARGMAAYANPTTAVDGFRQAWSLFTDRGTPVIVIHDTPRATASTAECVVENELEPERCDSPEEAAFPVPDLLVEAAEGQPDVHLLDFTSTFCWDGTCKAAIGGVTVYRDEHHMTATFSRSLGPTLERALQASDLIP